MGCSLTVHRYVTYLFIQRYVIDLSIEEAYGGDDGCKSHVTLDLQTHENAMLSAKRIHPHVHRQQKANETSFHWYCHGGAQMASRRRASPQNSIL